MAVTDPNSLAAEEDSRETGQAEAVADDHPAAGNSQLDLRSRPSRPCRGRLRRRRPFRYGLLRSRDRRALATCVAGRGVVGSFLGLVLRPLRYIFVVVLLRLFLAELVRIVA
jgi:hypothetical protein